MPALTGAASLHRSKMLEMLDSVMDEERVDRDGALPVLSSSLDLFLGMKNATSRCLPLSEGQTFFLLYKVRGPPRSRAPGRSPHATVRAAATGVQGRVARVLPAAAGEAAETHEQRCAAVGRLAVRPPRALTLWPRRAGGVELYKLPNHDAVEYACNVVNTCVYCAQTVPQVRACQGVSGPGLSRAPPARSPPLPVRCM